MQSLIDFLNTSYTAYQAVENAKKILIDNGFLPLYETDSWVLKKGGKYFVERNASSLIAFQIGETQADTFRIAASHTDSPALKLKGLPPVLKSGNSTLNVEPYGGGIWASFFDRPLKIAGRVFVKAENGVKEKNVVSNYNVTIPSLAIHQNREVNKGVPIDEQVDLQPLLSSNDSTDFFSSLCDGEIISHDLYLSNAQAAYEFGMHNEFVASPRVDNLTSVYSSLQGLVLSNGTVGTKVVAIFDNEEVGSLTYQGAGSDFLQNTLRRIVSFVSTETDAYARALARSFLLSLDNAHAMHPNHPERSDPHRPTLLGQGIAIKFHAKKCYATDAKSAAVIESVFNKEDVKYQYFYNRSDAKSGGTLGAAAISQEGILCVDLGMPQLAMHSALESFAKADYTELEKGLVAFFNAQIFFDRDGVSVK